MGRLTMISAHEPPPDRSEKTGHGSLFDPRQDVRNVLAPEPPPLSSRDLRIKMIQVATTTHTDPTNEKRSCARIRASGS
jgi:hypothetical protein